MSPTETTAVETAPAEASSVETTAAAAVATTATAVPSRPSCVSQRERGDTY
jgi:hypothetical protein